MGKFKVGDIVRVKADLKGGRIYDGVYFNSDMCRFCGKTYIITKYLDDEVDEAYRLQPLRGRIGDVKHWWFSDGMLESLVSKEFESFLRGFKNEV